MLVVAVVAPPDSCRGEPTSSEFGRKDLKGFFPPEEGTHTGKLPFRFFSVWKGREKGKLKIPKSSVGEDSVIFFCSTLAFFGLLFWLFEHGDRLHHIVVVVVAAAQKGKVKSVVIFCSCFGFSLATFRFRCALLRVFGLENFAEVFFDPSWEVKRKRRKRACASVKLIFN